MSIRVLTCISCNKDFSYTDAEQKYYKEKEYEEPKRCPSCRKRRKQSKNFNSQHGDDGNSTNGNSAAVPNEAGSQQRKRYYRCKCYSCGADTVVYHRHSYANPALCEGCRQGRGNRRRRNYLPT
ncbi:MAG: zinc-ribbon domain containing protein [Pseudomonadota bacterium]